MSDPLAWASLLALLGAVFGSHIATVAIRWPRGESAMAGRSRCDDCGSTLGAADLVPLLSYVALRGRCRRCGMAIAPSHFVIELLAAAIGVVAGVLAPGVAGAAGAVFGWLLLALAAIDRAAFWLPDPLVGALAVTGVAGGLYGLAPSFDDRLIGGMAGFGALFLVAASYRRLRGRVGLGGGDPKLFGAIGLWLGWRALPQVLLGACLIGFVIILIARLRGRTLGLGDRLPFGSLLAPAAFAMWCWQAASGLFA